MKPIERVLQIAAAKCERCGVPLSPEVLAAELHNTWAEAILDYLDEQHDEATWQQLSSHRPSGLVEWRRDGVIRKGFFVYSSTEDTPAWVGHWCSEDGKGVPVDTQQDDQWRYVEEA